MGWWGRFTDWAGDRLRTPHAQDPRTYFVERGFMRNWTNHPSATIYLFSHMPAMHWWEGLTTRLPRWAIEEVTKSPVCHAAANVGAGDVIEALPEGVTERSMRVYINGRDMIQAWRNTSMGAVQCEEFVRTMKARIGQKYDFQALEGFIGGPICDTPQTVICSELVVRALREVGVSIFNRLTAAEVAFHAHDFARRQIILVEGMDVPADVISPGDLLDWFKTHTNWFFYDSQNWKA